MALAVVCVVLGAVVVLLVTRAPNGRSAAAPAEVISAATEIHSRLYSYDFRQAGQSVEQAVQVTTGEFSARFERDLTTQLAPAYQQVSATVTVEAVTVGLTSLNAAGDEAVLLVFSTLTVVSNASGQQQPEADSECVVTEDGADACLQHQRLTITLVDGEWKASDVQMLS